MTSTWEADTGLTYACLVCGDPATHPVDVPRDLGLSVAYGMSGVCETCYVLAQHDDRPGLEARWRNTEPGSSTREDDVRAALGGAGHLHPPAATSPEYRDPAPAPLSGDDVARWADLGPRMRGRDADEVRFRGRVTGDASHQNLPVTVVREGYRVRSTAADGSPLLIVDGTTSVRFHDGVAVAAPFTPPSAGGPSLHVLDHRPGREVDLFGFGAPIGPIEPVRHLDRPAWKFRFAAPRTKPWDMRVVVDDATGIVLEERFGPDHVTRWEEFRTDVDIGPQEFTWNGPVTSAAEARARAEAGWEEQDRRRGTWFAEHVAARLTTPHGPVDIRLVLIPDDDGGEFHAELSGAITGSLARRPRSDDWWPLNWRTVHHRWSDTRFDWALAGETGPLDAPTVTALRQRLDTPGATPSSAQGHGSSPA